MKKLDRDFDIILYGATSFVGKLTAQYLSGFIKDKDINLAIAGRDMNKLISLSTTLNNPDISIIMANSNNPQSIDDMTSMARLVISTVGPYTHYGEVLIQSCVKYGTDYVDLCGELTFVRSMIDKYQEQAKQTGSRIISTCGFDSLPSDLGVHFLQKQSFRIHSSICESVSLKVKKLKGGMSGGTLASMITIMDSAKNDKKIQQQVLDPYLLVNENDKPKVKQPMLTSVEIDQKNKHWQAPFIMESTNNKIVHRSNYLSGFSYGKDFIYEEIMCFPDDIKGKLQATSTALLLSGFRKAVNNQKYRSLLTKYILPKPGTGPSKKLQENGFFQYELYGYLNTENKKTNEILIKIKVTGKKDPGYAGTAMMLSQAALCLAFDIKHSDIEGGFWSPAYAMGDLLIQRLQEHAMMTFEVIE